MSYSVVPAISLPVTTTYAGLIGVPFALTALGVGLTRVGQNKFYGADPDSTLLHRSRAAGTISDYAPYGMLLLGLMEYNKILSPNVLWWWGGLFTGFRLLHAFQLWAPEKRPQLLRTSSFVSTVLLMTAASVLLVVKGLKN